jgi:hypothetical protein
VQPSQLTGASTANHKQGVNTSVGSAGANNIATRSISRARQFGKDLTNMFSFTRQSSRQSTNTQNSGAALQVVAQQNVASIRLNKESSQSVASSVVIQANNQSIPRSARHNEQTGPV